MSDHRPRPLANAVALELERYTASAAMGDTGAAWWALERAHILSQPALALHLRVHCVMLAYAVRTLDPVEAIGQTARLLLAPLGDLTGRTPTGNTGRARVSAFARMPVPGDLRSVIDTADQR